MWFQCLDLLVFRHCGLAAVAAHGSAWGLHLLQYIECLYGEFACRRENDCLQGVGRGVDAFGEWNEESQRLACSRGSQYDCIGIVAYQLYGVTLHFAQLFEVQVE